MALTSALTTGACHLPLLGGPIPLPVAPPSLGAKAPGATTSHLLASPSRRNGVALPRLTPVAGSVSSDTRGCVGGSTEDVVHGASQAVFGSPSVLELWAARECRDAAEPTTGASRTRQGVGITDLDDEAMDTYTCTFQRLCCCVPNSGRC
jgi:hypothetical protein